VFTAGNLILGALAGLIVGLSKTALPGGALVVTPIVGAFVSGRLLPGTVLPLLIAADLFAVSWYHRHARWDLLRPMILSVAAGFAVGTAFFVAVGSSTRLIDIVIGCSILLIVAIQVWRIIRKSKPTQATATSAALYGSTGGFTTFVANAAGPILNTYLVGLGLGKEELIGTSAWFYFAVNVAKVPVYAAIGGLSHGGHFFTANSLAFDAACIPAVLVGLFSGRTLFHRLPERAFLVAVLVLSAAGAVKLLLP
jgi:uncharacterized protein